MLTVRPSAARGRTDLGWLDSRHSFSFGDYFDPAHTAFRTLRVLNDDRVAAGGGFGTHPHRDMEILTYVLSGALEHRDSLGNGSVLSAGHWQRMTAGTGVRHSEANASGSEPVHFLQIWLVPERKGQPPGYAELAPAGPAGVGRLRVVSSRDGRDGSMTVGQDVTLLAATLRPGDAVGHEFAPGRAGWLHVATGSATVNGIGLGPGDGLAVAGEPRIEVVAGAAAEVLLFDLA